MTWDVHWLPQGTSMMVTKVAAGAVVALNWPRGSGLVLCKGIHLPCMTGASRTVRGIMGRRCMRTEFSRWAAWGLLLRDAGASSGTAACRWEVESVAGGVGAGPAAMYISQGRRKSTVPMANYTAWNTYVSGLRPSLWGELGEFIEAVRVASE